MHVIKKTLISSFFLLMLFALQKPVFAQDDKSKRPSPPATVTQTVGGTKITINYSRPSVKGRKIWGDLVPYGKVWRTGANEATTFEVSKAVKIAGKALPAGKYGLFTLPTASTWTVIFNKVASQWGAYKYDASKDALRVDVTPTQAPSMNEQLLFKIDANGKVSLFWEQKEVDFTVSN